MNWELGVNRCKLLPLEWISNEFLLCSTENYVQTLTSQQWEEKVCIHVCVTWSPCYTAGKKKKLFHGVPIMAQWLTNPTRKHEVAGLIPGLELPHAMGMAKKRAGVGGW